MHERSESLVNGLSYTLKSQASLIESSRTATFFPSGPSSGISPTNSKLIKVVMSAENWLQTQTLVFTCTIRNLSDTLPLQLLGPAPSCLFQTVRCYVSGVPVSISEDYNKTHLMFSRCLSKAVSYTHLTLPTIYSV